MTPFKRIKVITSHVGLARFIADTADEPVGYIPTCLTDVLAAKDRYFSSPCRAIFAHDNGDRVVWFEVSHKRYEVYCVPADYKLLSTEAATTYHIAMLTRAAA